MAADSKSHALTCPTGTAAIQEEVVVNGRSKGIQAIDLTRVFSSPQDVKLLQLITKLDLSRNEIDRVEELRGMLSLRTLDISYNRVSSAVGLPNSLHSLNLSYNRLDSLEGVQTLYRLQDLDVRANRLTHLTGLQPGMVLRTLYADDNRLVNIKDVYGLQQLRTLSVANNFIDNAEDLLVLSGTPRLQVLCLAHNPVAAADGLATMISRLLPRLLVLDHMPVPQLTQRVRVHADGTEEQGVHVRDGATPRASFACVPAVEDSQMHRSGLQPDVGRQWLHDGAVHDMARSAGVSSTPSQCTTPVVEQEPPQPVPCRPSCTAVADVPKQASTTAANVTQKELRVASDAGRGGSEAGGSRLSALAHVSRVQPTTWHTAHTSSNKGDGAADSAKQAITAGAHTSGYTVHQGCVTRRGSCGPNSHTSKENRPLPTTSSPKADDKAAQTALLYDALSSKELLAKENRALLARLRKCEAELRAARGVISTQLHGLAEARLECEAHRHGEAQLREKLERVVRQQRGSDERHRQTLQQMQEEHKRCEVQYEAELAILRLQQRQPLRIAGTSALPECTRLGNHFTSSLKHVQSNALPVKDGAEANGDAVLYACDTAGGRETVVHTPPPPPRPAVLTSPLMESDAESETRDAEVGLDGVGRGVYDVAASKRGAVHSSTEEEATVELTTRSGKRRRSARFPQSHTMQNVSLLLSSLAATDVVCKSLTKESVWALPSRCDTPSGPQTPAVVIESDEGDE